ncbi:UNVERIFIED_CONTAM: hypothetical protein RMT77_014366 [Armadillidium vulgare]
METRLEDLCKVKLVIEFCTQRPEMKKSIVEAIKRTTPTYSPDICDYLNFDLNGKFSDTLRNLPMLLRNNMPYYLIPLIGREMIAWIFFHGETFDLEESYCINFIKSFKFNSKGVLNKELAALELVKDKNLSSVVRFKIACHYFFSEYILMLWENLTEIEKLCLRQAPPKDYTSIYVELIWSAYKQRSIQNLIDKGESVINDKVFVNACIYSFCSKNDISFQNYFEKLSKPNKLFVLQFSENILRFKLENITIDPNKYNFYNSNEPYLKMVEYLFTQLNSEQLKNLFQQNLDYFVLKALLNWPYQHLFMKAVNIFWENISNNNFYILLHVIMNMLGNYHLSKSFDYKLLFIKFWNMGLKNHKKYVLSVESGKTLINPILNSTDYIIIVGKETFVYQNHFILAKIFCLDDFNDENQFIIKLIMEDVSEEVKQKILDNQEQKICNRVARAGNFYIEDVFFKCCVPKYLVEKYKSNILKRKQDALLEPSECDPKIEPID